MSKRLRWFALLSVVFLLVAACSKPASQQSAGEEQEGEGLSALGEDVEDVTPEEAEAEAAERAAQADNLAGQGVEPTGYAALNPTADIDHARKVASLIKPQSTDYPNGNPNTWAGVTKDSIKLAFSYDASSCGVNLINAINTADGNLATGGRYFRPAAPDQRTANEWSEEAVKVLVDYWNRKGHLLFGDAPHLTPLFDKFNKPGHPFYGRKLNFEMVDGGSFQCPERTRSGAVAVKDRIKPFSVVTDDVPGIVGSGFVMSEQLSGIPAAQRPMHFGIMDPSDTHLSKWAPYVWTQFQSGTRAAELTASLVCNKYVGKKAVNAPQMKDQTRVFALAYPNNPSARQVAGEFKAFAKKDCGKDLIASENEFEYPEDPARAADFGAQMAVKMNLTGVTSVIYFNDLLAPLFHMIGFDGQDFRPEFVWTGTAYQDTQTVQRLYNQEMTDKASFGMTNFGMQGFAYGGGDAFWIYHEAHKVAPNGKKCDPSSDAGMMHSPDFCRAPGAITTWYYSWLPLVAGFLFSGPNLTPKNVSVGLQNYPLTRYGVNGPTDDPQAVLVQAKPGQYYFIADGSEFQWRSGYVSPPPEQKLGWANFPDGQRHYMAWPNKLASQWEKDGKFYNAYLGNAKYASFKPYAPTDLTCGDAPSGKCETDGYPRWLPMK